MKNDKKYIIILGDGMSDYKDENGKTPLMCADKPEIDYIAQRGETGLCRTIPKGMKPGSDNANLSVLGYDPLLYYTGRSPLEAVSIGVKLSDTDVCYRCNLVTLSGDEPYEKKVMLDYSSDEISSAESGVLIEYLQKNMDFSAAFELYKGVSYRHCLVMHGGSLGAKLAQPHDISDKAITDYMPQGENAAVFRGMMIKSYGLLKGHPINTERQKRGLRPANSMWLWGEGKKPALPSFKEKFGKSGAMISAVDLLKGIAILAGMKVCEVKGATGNIHTDFEGKAAAALKTLKEGSDFVYVHVEAADECGHRGEKENKVKAIEYLSRRLIAPLVKGLKEEGFDYSMLIMPDHATPLKLKTHTADPVPYILYRSYDEREPSAASYNEDSCAASGIIEEKGHTLIQKLLSK